MKGTPATLQPAFAARKLMEKYGEIEAWTREGATDTTFPTRMISELGRVREQLPSRTPHSATFRIMVQALETVVGQYERQDEGGPQTKRQRAKVTRAWHDVHDLHQKIWEMQRATPEMEEMKSRTWRALKTQHDRHMQDPREQQLWAYPLGFTCAEDNWTTPGTVLSALEEVGLSDCGTHCRPHDEDACEVKCNRRAVWEECTERGSCKNRRLQLRQYARTKVVTTQTGFGLAAAEDIDEDTLLGEYTGELIGSVELERRNRSRPQGDPTYTVLYNEEGDDDAPASYVDARMVGGRMRFLNHSCEEANCQLQRWLVGTEWRLGAFTTRKVGKDEELLINYEEGNLAPDRQIKVPLGFTCQCGASTCQVQGGRKRKQQDDNGKGSEGGNGADGEGGRGEREEQEEQGARIGGQRTGAAKGKGQTGGLGERDEIEEEEGQEDEGVNGKHEEQRPRIEGQGPASDAKGKGRQKGHRERDEIEETEGRKHDGEDSRKRSQGDRDEEGQEREREGDGIEDGEELADPPLHDGPRHQREQHEELL
eukprot:2095367-Rhodomonas_salina.2